MGRTLSEAEAHIANDGLEIPYHLKHNDNFCLMVIWVSKTWSLCSKYTNFNFRVFSHNAFFLHHAYVSGISNVLLKVIFE